MRHTSTRTKLAAAILLLSLLPVAARAQVGEYRNDFAIGVNGGVLFNKVSFDPTIKQNFYMGKTMGITLRYTSERYFGMCCAIQAEVNYAQMGWKELIETSTDTYERRVNYVQVPLLARLGFGKEYRGVMGYLVLGPQIAFYISDKDKRGGDWSSYTLSLRPNNVTEQYDLSIQKKFEYGLTGGAGMEVNTKVGHFMIEGRYYFGLSDMFNNGKADYFARSASGAIIAKVTYLFDLIKTKRQSAEDL
ncbi:MAG: PorT family protein [Prevotellaceae bacterium]|nr:PorT family protein [Prevotellaceae bacterium]